MQQLAADGDLIGAEESRVEQLLGPATLVLRGWSKTNTKSGEPTHDAVYNTTYKYSPYPLLPLFDTFEVHCRNGKVVSIELFDD
jgi:hypothetical protein